jgi:hypothetical protein
VHTSRKKETLEKTWVYITFNWKQSQQINLLYHTSTFIRFFTHLGIRTMCVV